MPGTFDYLRFQDVSDFPRMGICCGHGASQLTEPWIFSRCPSKFHQNSWISWSKSIEALMATPEMCPSSRNYSIAASCPMQAECVADHFQKAHRIFAGCCMQTLFDSETNHLECGISEQSYHIMSLILLIHIISYQSYHSNHRYNFTNFTNNHIMSIESCQVAMGLNPGTPANIKMDKQNVYHQSTPKYGYEMVVVLECYRG